MKKFYKQNWDDAIEYHKWLKLNEENPFVDYIGELADLLDDAYKQGFQDGMERVHRHVAALSKYIEKI